MRSAINLHGRHLVAITTAVGEKLHKEPAECPAAVNNDISGLQRTNVCLTYWPTGAFVTGFQSAARRPRLNDWTKLITPM
jgi:hypothetical protein